MIRVLVAEDSATTRELLVQILKSDPDIQVIGEAKNGEEAVAMTRRLRPDVVTMDIRMPLMDGFEATKRIMVEAPTPIVIVSASVDVREVEVSINALRVGALTVIAKPSGPGAPDFADVSRHFLATVKAMSQVKVVRRWPDRQTRLPSPGPRAAEGPRARVVAMAASTGGPAALCHVLSELPATFPVPVLVVQHIAQGFLPGFASWLNTNVSLRVKIADAGEALAARTIYLPPDDRHLGVEGGEIVISGAPPIGGFRPSASFLFESVARSYGSSALAVVLTGMGQDGVEGLRVVHEVGGQILVQDEASSVVYGMPAAAVRAGLSNAILALKDIPARLMRSLQEGTP
jgi:two-component system, chemotaxis family, protein-glutamate methylesterase/glutaminase